MNFLDKLKEKLSSVAPVAPKNKSVIGVDIGSSSIKLVQLRREKGRALLETYGAILLGPYASVDSGKAVHLTSDITTPAIADLIKEANVTTQDAGMSVPFTSAMTRIIKVPKMPKEQLSKVIPIEARKFIPMPLNEVVLNWFVLPDRASLARAAGIKDSKKIVFENDYENKVEFQEALIVAIHKDAVNNMQDIAIKSGLQVSFFELEAFAAARSSVEYELAPIMLVDIGALSTKVYIIEAGILRFSHLINIGSQRITENIMRAFAWPYVKAERIKKEVGMDMNLAVGMSPQDTQMLEEAIEAVVNRIFTDVNRVMINYEKKYNRSVARVILSGAGVGLKGIQEFAQKKLSVDVVFADPFSKVQAPAFLNDVLKSIGPEFAVAVGLALRRLDSI